ncbi:MAG: hydantoinase B/oxoprolinase family protein, partial [Candidatus Binatia bacterium]|nr:hydantoinase B/oxoprolinase family protein [Candidatus Binatia bacterium]
CGGAISHINDWMVLLPIFYQEKELLGWASMFGHQLDCGGPIPGSLPVQATTIYGEGIRIPPFKLYRRGELNEEALGIILHNVRQPEFNRGDLMGLIAGCRTAEKRVLGLCNRFGKETYLAALEALFERTRRAMAQLIRENVPEERLSFEDYIDDDGLGNGPFKIKLTMWREGERAIFDWTGTDPQASGPVNLYLNERMFKLLVGVYLIMVHDPQILFNDGYQELMEVILPEGSLLKPRFPAALGNRTHALARIFDVLCGCLGQRAPQFSTAAGFSTSPHLIYSGLDAEGSWFQLLEICYGGIPGRPIGDGIDGHSMWPLTKNIPTEYIETYYPVRIDSLECLPDSGGAGNHRGGNGVEKVYHFLAPGEVSIHDDRWLTYPWGILGGKPGARSSKLLRRKDGTEEVLGSKLDNVQVEAGDILFYRTWGGGGWGDPLERPYEEVRKDAIRGLLSIEKAQEEYGVILNPATFEVDEAASKKQHSRIRSGRGE